MMLKNSNKDEQVDDDLEEYLPVKEEQMMEVCQSDRE